MDICKKSVKKFFFIFIFIYILFWNILIKLKVKRSKKTLVTKQHFWFFHVKHDFNRISFRLIFSHLLHFFRFIMGKHFFSIFSIIWSMSSCLKMGLNESKTTERRWGQKIFHPKNFFSRKMIFLPNFLFPLKLSKNGTKEKLGYFWHSGF